MSSRLFRRRKRVQLAFGSLSEYVSASKTGGHSIFGYSGVWIVAGAVCVGDCCVCNTEMPLSITDEFVDAKDCESNGVETDDELSNIVD